MPCPVIAAFSTHMDRRGNLGWLDETADGLPPRQQRDGLLLLLLDAAPGGQRADGRRSHRRVDPAGADRVDRDTSAGKFGGCGPD
jgi:hypothetical protein